MESLHPCWHMKGLLHGHVDGALPGLLRLYVEAHVDRCPQCTAALHALRSLALRLNRLAPPNPEGRLTSERAAAVHAVLDRLRSTRPPRR